MWDLAGLWSAVRFSIFHYHSHCASVCQTCKQRLVQGSRKFFVLRVQGEAAGSVRVCFRGGRVASVGL